jgi:cellulose 1,4-beta-cellobiosidase
MLAAYNVKRSTVSGGPYTTIATGITAYGYTDPSVVNGVQYYYVVSAVANGGESGNSNETSAKPVAPLPPPTGLTAKTSHDKVQLTWKQSTAPNLSRNRIYRSTSGGAYVMIAEISPGTSWTDNTVRSKTDYIYVVDAVTISGGQSPFSNAVKVRAK